MPAMSETGTATDSTVPSPDRPPTAILVNRCEVRLWSSAQEERLRRALARCGVTDLRTEGDAPAAASGPFILLRTDFVLEDSLIKALIRTPDRLLVVTLADGGCAAIAAHAPRQSVEQVVELLRQPRSAPNDIAAVDLAILGPAEVGSTYDQALRKRAVPFALPLVADTQLAVLERRLFDGSYKGVTDLVTKYVWPRPALAVTRWCAKRASRPMW